MDKVINKGDMDSVYKFIVMDRITMGISIETNIMGMDSISGIRESIILASLLMAIWYGADWKALWGIRVGFSMAREMGKVLVGIPLAKFIRVAGLMAKGMDLDM